MYELNLTKLYSDLFAYEKIMKEAKAEYQTYSEAVKANTPRMKFLDRRAF